MHRRTRLSAATTIAAAATLLAFQVSMANDADRSRPSLSVGDVVTYGTYDDWGRCFFKDSPPLTLEEGEWIAVELDADCTARVRDKWTGRLSDGPERADAVVAAAGGDVVAAVPAVMAAAATTCKTAKQHVFSFGLGGAFLDKLTHVWSSLTYCYNDTYVWGSSTSGSACAGQSENAWAWVVDYCVYSSQSLASSTSSVWSTVKGQFRCTPEAQLPCALGGGYHHHLFDKVKGLQSGHSSCTWWWDGWVVGTGPEAEIISGCV